MYYRIQNNNGDQNHSEVHVYKLTRDPGGIGPVLTALVAGGRRG